MASIRKNGRPPGWAYEQLIKDNVELRKGQLDLNREIEELNSQLKNLREELRESQVELYKSLTETVIYNTTSENGSPCYGNISSRRTTLLDAVCSAINENNLYRVKFLMNYPAPYLRLGEKPPCVNKRGDHYSCNLLLHAAKVAKMEIFDYLCTLDGHEVNRTDCQGHLPLLRLSELPQEYYALKLIEMGAEVLYEKDRITPLHLAINTKNNNLVQKLLEKGANIDAQDPNGKTPLHWASVNGDDEQVFMLLSYGADPTVLDNSGDTAFDCAVFFRNFDLANIISDFVFHVSENNPIKYCTFATILNCDVPELIEKICCHVNELIYDVDSSSYIYSYDFDRMDCKRFRLCLEKFPTFIKDVIRKRFHSNYSVFNLMVDTDMCDNERQLENVCALIHSDFVTDIVEYTYDPMSRLILQIVKIMYQFKYSPYFVHQTILILLSRGVQLHSEEAETIFRLYGHCELFNDILYMDINMSKWYNQMIFLSRMMYDVRLTLDYPYYGYILPYEMPVRDSLQLLDYFAHPNLKYFCNQRNDREISDKIQKLPCVPSLVELTRESTRQQIIKKYKVKNSCQFYTLLNALGLSQDFQDILSYKTTLY